MALERPPRTATLPELLAALGHEDAVVRTTAARSLGRLGSAGRPAAAALAAATRDGDPMVRAMAAAALGKVAPAPALALPALVDLLEDPVPPVRFWACEALGGLGPEAAAALGALERLGTSEQAALRQAATVAVARIRGAGASRADDGLGRARE